MIVFPYVEFLGLAEDRVFRPMIPVMFRANGQEFKSYSLIDSGADYSILSIGQNGFLGKFKVILNGKNKEVEINN